MPSVSAVASLCECMSYEVARLDLCHCHMDFCEPFLFGGSFPKAEELECRVAFIMVRCCCPTKVDDQWFLKPVLVFHHSPTSSSCFKFGGAQQAWEGREFGTPNPSAPIAQYWCSSAPGGAQCG